jgi:hypothetical protein
MKRRFEELVLLLICAALLAVQLLIPPFIGIANNGDFPKVAGRLSLGPRVEGQNFLYFVPDYVRAERYHWESEVLSSDLAPAWLAVQIHDLFRSGNGFDIRWLGAVDCALFLAAFYGLLVVLRPESSLVRWVVAGAALLIFTDVCYSAYLNSFYSDAAGLLGLLLAVVAAVRLATLEPPRSYLVLLFGLAALFWITSKSQHGMWGFLPAAFLFFLSRRWPARRARLLAQSVVAVLLMATVAVVAITPKNYKTQPLFNLIFFDLAMRSAAPLADLRELGLGPGDLRLIGLNAFSPGSPGDDPQFLAEFQQRTSYGRLARFYLAHPGRALDKLKRDLETNTFQMRPQNLSNFRQQDGHPPGAQTTRFALWSDLRSRLYLLWPYYVVLLHLSIAAGAIWLIRRKGGTAARVAWITLGLIAITWGEFAVASLADACETYRHLFLFHALTDLTICLALAGILTQKSNRRYTQMHADKKQNL